MGLPASKGIGTGEAQVFNQDKTYEAFQGLANRKMALDDYNKRLEEQKAKEAKEDEQKKRQQTNALWSTVKVDTRGMKPADIELTQNEVNEFRDKWLSRAEEIANFGAARNEFDKEFQNIQGNVNRRVDSYNQIKTISERLNANPEEYLEAQIDYARELYDEPDVDMGQNIGLFGQKLKIGDPNADYVKLYKDSFFRDEYSNTSDDKKSWFKGDKFLPDEVTFEQFKKNNTPGWMKKWNVVYADDESLDRDDSGELTDIGTEQMLKKAHDAIKGNLRQSSDYGSVTEEPTSSGGAGGAGGDFKLVPSTVQLANGQNAIGIAISKVGNKDVKSFDVSIVQNEYKKDGKTVKTDEKGNPIRKPTTVSLIPSGIAYNKKDNEWYMQGYTTKTVFNPKTDKTEVIRGDYQEIKMSKNSGLMNDFKARYEVKGDMLDYYNKLNSGEGNSNTTNSNTTASAEELIKKYSKQ